MFKILIYHGYINRAFAVFADYESHLKSDFLNKYAWEKQT